MQQTQHQKHQSYLQVFPYDQYDEPRDNQVEAWRLIGQHDGFVILELPTGSGKTLVGYVFLKDLEKSGAGPLFYITPTKAEVDGVKRKHPGVKVAYGRHEYDCLYYGPDQKFKADEIPCLLLKDCKHRVNQDSGETFVPGAERCPYYQAKYEAKLGGIVVCTQAFYLFTQLFSKEMDRPAALVVDEVHRLANVVRQSLSYEITDYNLNRIIALLRSADIEVEAEADSLENFVRTMIAIAKRRPAKEFSLLEADEIRELMVRLEKVDVASLDKKINQAIRHGQLDALEHRELLKQLQTLIYDIFRYLHSFEYSLPTAERAPLNYTVAFYKKELVGRERVQYRLVIKAYHVAALIRKYLLAPKTVAYSATIGKKPEVLTWEMGMKAPFHSLLSDFPTDNARIFMPLDTPNLSVKNRPKGQPKRVMERIVRTCQRFAQQDLRSLVVVVSELERQKFLKLCAKANVHAISYGNGIVAKEAVACFKAGEGKVLVGTTAHYGEGIDLPKQIAPIIFFLRPGYPDQRDPTIQFEKKRYGTQRWHVWNWRVMLEALQVRGRNIRSAEDMGVTFFISQQFRRFLFGSLPEWLQPTYRGQLNFEQCVQETLKLFR